MDQLRVEEEVRNVILDNPAIEVAEKDAQPAGGDDYSDDDYSDDNGGEEIAPDTTIARDPDDREDGDDDIPDYRTTTRNSSPDDKVFEPIITNDKTLSDHLTEQLGELDLTEKERQIADYIIGNIDSNGYLTRSVEAISDDLIFQAGIDVTEDEINAVLQTVRDLDPPGVAATDLRECILLQLERRRGTPDAQNAYEIVDKHFPEFEKKHYDKIMSAMKLTADDFRRALDVIRSTDPKPGSAYGGEATQKAQHIIPDFSVEVDGDTITLTLPNNIPELQIAETYQAMYDNISAAKPRNRNEVEANRYVKDKYESAKAFIQMLRQRQQTLFTVMSAIVNWQKEFFLTEDETTLRPMVLKDIAAITGFDISVVSRATAGKYVTTQGGTYPLKFFFSEGLKHESGEDVSTREIQSALKKIIEGEDKRKPYSDEALCSLLKQKGYEIARRTVAKYRENLGFPVARLRKEL